MFNKMFNKTLPRTTYPKEIHCPCHATRNTQFYILKLPLSSSQLAIFMSSVRNLLLERTFSRFRKSVPNRLLTLGLTSHNLSQNFIKPFSARQRFNDPNACILRNCIYKQQAHISQTHGFVQDRPTPTYFKMSLYIINGYVEIKCQLDATQGFYCRSYCLLNMFRASICPSSGAQGYYTVVAACSILCCGFFK